MVLIYYFLIMKREPLVGEALIEINSAVAKQTKNVRFCFFQNILLARIFKTCQRDV